MPLGQRQKHHTLFEVTQPPSKAAVICTGDLVQKRFSMTVSSLLGAFPDEPL
jgi:hypothetical protein